MYTTHAAHNSIHQHTQILTSTHLCRVADRPLTEPDMVPLERCMWYWQRTVECPKGGITADNDRFTWPVVYQAL